MMNYDPQSRDAHDMLALYRPDLAEVLGSQGLPSYRLQQTYEHLVRRPMRPFAEATALPGSIRVSLDELGASTLALAAQRVAADGTVKLLLSTRDGSLVETVIMPYRRRVTLCVSSQVGCAVGCAFCATGAMGFRRNLSVAEIVDQVRAAAGALASAGAYPSNVVFMGMGEPLLNLQSVLASIRVLTDPGGMNLAHRSIAVSTVGIPAGIARLGRAEPQVNLALSLHGADDRTRALLIPTPHCHPLAEVLAAAWQHFEQTHRKLLVEYVLLAGLNDSPADARRLAALLRGHVVTVNLLTWNPVRLPGGLRDHTTDPPRRPAKALSRFKPSLPAAVAAFREALVSARIEAVIRKARGSDIEAACGQLAGELESYR
jgi:23S rRNA (adenine2503-C2)-methyltransferase